MWRCVAKEWVQYPEKTSADSSDNVSVSKNGTRDYTIQSSPPKILLVLNFVFPVCCIIFWASVKIIFLNVKWAPPLLSSEATQCCSSSCWESAAALNAWLQFLQRKQKLFIQTDAERLQAAKDFLFASDLGWREERFREGGWLERAGSRKERDGGQKMEGWSF